MNERSYQSFTELEVWKKARQLKKEIFNLVEMFPAAEKYRLADQLIRSSRGINSSISEGHGRYTFKDRLHYCVIARGSLAETYNHLIDAYDCSYINYDQLKDYKNKIDEVHRLLNGYIAHLRRNQSARSES
jgi:four helix bundle protein